MEKLWTLLFLMMIEKVTARAEPGLIESLIVAAHARPWLWSVYVFSVGLPVILFISFMWPDKRFGPPDQPYYYKKSDDVQEDDPERSPLLKPAQASPEKPKEAGPRKREVRQNMRKSDLELKVD